MPFAETGDGLAARKTLCSPAGCREGMPRACGAAPPCPVYLFRQKNSGHLQQKDFHPAGAGEHESESRGVQLLRGEKPDTGKTKEDTEQATFGSPSVPAGSSALLRPSPAGGLQSPAEPLRVSGFARPRWRRSTAPPAATVPVAPRPPPRRCRGFKVATPFRRVGCAHSLSVVMPPPCRHSRGGLAVAPPGRHPGGEMHSAKTFCEGPQKLLSPPPSFLPRRRSFALCRESTSQGDGVTITTGEKQNAHTKRQRQDRRRRNRRKM